MLQVLRLQFQGPNQKKEIGKKCQLRRRKLRREEIMNSCLLMFKTITCTPSQLSAQLRCAKTFSVRHGLSSVPPHTSLHMSTIIYLFLLGSLSLNDKGTRCDDEIVGIRWMGKRTTRYWMENLSLHVRRSWQWNDDEIVRIRHTTRFRMSINFFLRNCSVTNLNSSSSFVHEREKDVWELIKYNLWMKHCHRLTLRLTISFFESMKIVRLR